MFRLTIHAINKLIVVHFRSILHGDGDQTTSTGFIWCVLLYNMKSIWSTVRKQIMHFNVCYFLKASKHQKTHLEEPLAMLVENSFEVKSCCSHARHNFSRFSRPRLRHFKFRCCCEQIICIFGQNFSVETSWPGTTCTLLTCVRTCIKNYKYFISGVFRSITKNPRQSPNRRGGENRRRRMRTSLVLNSHKEKEEGKFSCWNGRFGQ